MGKVSQFMIQGDYMKESGTQIKETVVALNYIRIKIRTKANSRTIKRMEKEFTHGKMVKSMMESGQRELNKGMEFGKVFMEILIQDNGKTVKLMDMEYICGKMVSFQYCNNFLLGDKYEGEWKACLRHGNGTDFFTNGDAYIG